MLVAPDLTYQSPLPRPPPLQQLIDSVKAEQTLNCLLLLSHTLPEDINVVHGHPDFCTPLHIASQLGNVVILQLLIWVGATTAPYMGRCSCYCSQYGL